MDRTGVAELSTSPARHFSGQESAIVAVVAPVVRLLGAIFVSNVPGELVHPLRTSAVVVAVVLVRAARAVLGYVRHLSVSASAEAFLSAGCRQRVGKRRTAAIDVGIGWTEAGSIVADAGRGTAAAAAAAGGGVVVVVVAAAAAVAVVMMICLG
jgi:hypothetical protein